MGRKDCANGETNLLEEGSLTPTISILRKVLAERQARLHQHSSHAARFRGCNVSVLTNGVTNGNFS